MTAGVEDDPVGMRLLDFRCLLRESGAQDTSPGCGWTEQPKGRERNLYEDGSDAMGWMNQIGALAGQLSGNGDQAKVAGGLMQSLEQHPGGIQGILDTIKGNGMAEHANAWASGEQTTATPEQVQQGLGGTGLIERTAERAGVSPQVAAMAMTTLLPMVIQHFAPGGNAAPQSQFGGLAQQFLGKIL